MTKAERDMMLTWTHADRRCSTSDLEHDLDELEITLDDLENDLVEARNHAQTLVVLESDMLTDDQIDYANRVYAGG